MGLDRVGEQFGIGWALTFLAERAYEAGEFEVSESRAVEALSIGTASGLLQVVAVSRRILAVLALERGEYDEAERLLDISHKTLYRLMNSGELQSFVVGRSRRIPMASIRAYIEARLEKFPKSKPRRASG